MGSPFPPDLAGGERPAPAVPPRLRIAVHRLGALPLAGHALREIYRRVSALCEARLRKVPGIAEVRRVGGSVSRCAPGLSDLDFAVTLDDRAPPLESLLAARRAYRSLRRRWLIPGECLAATPSLARVAEALAPSVATTAWGEPPLAAGPERTALAIHRLWRATRLAISDRNGLGRLLSERQLARAAEFLGEPPPAGRDPFAGIVLAVERASRRETERAWGKAPERRRPPYLSPGAQESRALVESWIASLGAEELLMPGRCPWIVIPRGGAPTEAERAWRLIRERRASRGPLHRLPVALLPESADRLLALGWRAGAMPPSWHYDDGPDDRHAYWSARARAGQRLIGATGALIFADASRLRVEVSAALHEVSRLAAFGDEADVLSAAESLSRTWRADVPAEPSRLVREAGESLLLAWRWAERLAARAPRG